MSFDRQVQILIGIISLIQPGHSFNCSDDVRCISVRLILRRGFDISKLSMANTSNCLDLPTKPSQLRNSLTANQQTTPTKPRTNAVPPNILRILAVTSKEEKKTNPLPQFNLKHKKSMTNYKTFIDKIHATER